jgi:hypothetical protein
MADAKQLLCCKHTRCGCAAPPDGIELEWRQPALKVWVHDDGADLFVQRKRNQGHTIPYHQLVVVDLGWPCALGAASELFAPPGTAAAAAAAAASIVVAYT